MVFLGDSINIREYLFDLLKDLLKVCSTKAKDVHLGRAVFVLLLKLDVYLLGILH